MIINGSKYTIPELDFNAMCMLEDMGVSLTEMDRKVLSTVRGFLALAMGGDHDKAGREMEAHLAAGGSLDELVSEVNRAVSESGFFQALAKVKTARDAEGKA
ncbi:MAG: hypothetical protein V8Q42_08995 [Anaerovoracaceae bacterium]